VAAITACNRSLLASAAIALAFSVVGSTAGQDSPRSQGLASATTSSQKDTTDQQPALQRRDLRYTVHASDTLELTFPLTPEFNQAVTVQPDGFVSLRGLGNLPVAGETLPELTASLTKAYSTILKDPMILVDPKDYEKPYYIVWGQVNKAGKFDWRGEVTVSQALAVAGGFNDNAKHSQVLLFRRVSDKWAQGSIIDVKHMLNSGNLSEDPILQPGDMLYVPKNTLSKVKPFIPLPGVGVYANPF